jgi:hypothetical protein
VCWRTPDTYRTAGIQRGTVTSNFYEIREILCREEVIGFGSVASQETKAER